jgi:uncharacterized protein YkwD
LLVLTACGGGGSSSHISPTLPSAVSLASPSSVSGAPGSAGTTIALSDYFSGAPVSGASVIVDGVATAAAAGALHVTPAVGLHTLAVTAPGYATYNGALQVTSTMTVATRNIALFPVSPLVAQWLAQINVDRAAGGEPAVALDDMLTIAAFDHATDMGVRGYFAHFDTHGFAPTTRALLLGSMLMGSENIAAGYASWSDAESAFVAERLLLPNQTQADCATAASSATDHYCNLAAPSHNWVGLAIAAVPGSPYGTYYDQEFGDLYGVYDTTAITPLATLGSSLSLDLAPANGASFLSATIATMPAPVPIPIATLNADPACATSCPPQDRLYPATVAGSGSGSPAQVTLSTNQLEFVAQNVSVSTYVGAGSWALTWPGGTVSPDRYTDADDDATSADRSAALARRTPVVR